MNKKISDSRFFWLDVARCVAIISITLNHAVNRAYHVYEGQSAEFFSIPLGSTLFKTVVYVFSRIGVPLFLMISGALLFNKEINNAEDIKKFYKHNLLSLLITSEIWMFIMYWVIYIMEGHFRTESIFMSILGLLETMFFVNQTTFHSMWYIPMILCIYLFLPFLIMIKNKVPKKIIMIPMAATLIYYYLIPTLNDILCGLGSSTFSVQEDVILPQYLLIVVVGYLISKGVLKNLNKYLLMLGAVFSFAVSVGIQMFLFSQKPDVILRYEFVGFFVCAFFLFEIFRRYSDRIAGIRPAVEGLSKISFGIYFVHIIIMEILRATTYSFLATKISQPMILIYLEVVSFIGSIIFIKLVSLIPKAKKYLFMIR